MINPISKRHQSILKGNDSKADLTNYKELYEQCKKNVAIFMKHVDKEIMTILKNHQVQKKKLQDQIDQLRNKVKMQTNTSFILPRNPSIRSFSQNKGSSSIRDRSQQSIADDGFSKFTGVELKNYSTMKNIDFDSSLTLSRKPSLQKYESQKENTFVPSNSIYEEEEFGLLPLRSVKNVPRSKRFQEKKKKLEFNEEVKNVKDFLQNMRGNLDCKKAHEYFKAKNDEKISGAKIISPELFSARMNRM